MKEVAWDPKFSTGNIKIDFEHQIFVNLLANLKKALTTNADSRFVERLILEVEQYTIFHFISEENIMLQEAYPLYEEHKQMHTSLLLELKLAKEQFKNKEKTYESFLLFLFNWFDTHTCNEDVKIANYVEKRQKENEITAINPNASNEDYPAYKLELNFLLDDILNKFHAAIFIIDSSNRVVWVNDATEIFFGLEKKDVILHDSRELVKNKIKHLFKEPEKFEQNTLIAYNTVNEAKRFTCHVLPTDKREERVLQHWSRTIVSGAHNGGRIVYYYDITKRYKSEQIVKESEEKYRHLSNQFEAILDHIPGLVFHKDKMNNFISVNKYVADAHKTTKKELEGKSIFDIYAKEDADNYYLDDLEVINTGRAKLHISEKWQTGHVNRWVSTSKIPFVNTDGEIIGVIGLGFDVTAKKEAEEALIESEKRQRKILDSFKDGIYINSPDYKIVYANAALQKKLGRNPVNELCHKAIHNSDKKCNWCVYGSLQQQQQENIEYELEEATGKILEVNNTLLDDGNKLSVFKDITSRKLAEKALLESEEKYKHLIKNARTAILKLDKNGFITFVNEYASELFGYSESEIIGEHVIGVIVPDFDSENTDLSKMVNMFTSSTGKHYDTVNENENITKSGKRIWMSWSNKALVDNNDQIIEIVSVGIDISDRRKVEKELEIAKKDADEANRLKSEFLANMSHEIRTPMNAIIGFSSILKRTVTDEKHRNYVEIIAKSGNNLLDLINDILDLSKIEAGQLKIQKEETSIHDIFNDVQAVFAGGAEKQQISLNLEIDKNLPRSLVVDALRIRQVLLNLISNAIKFTEKGAVSVIVTSADEPVRSDGKLDLIVKIKDTGIGIPDNQLVSIFGSFHQVQGQSTRKYGGTGLGLSITKRLVELMGGSITVDSSVGAGTTFTVLLRDVEISAFQIVELKEEGAFNYTFSKSKILHVEDVSDNREIIALFLDDEDIEIKEAVNGKEALRTLETYMPDLILMDIQMPELNGYETTKIIRQNKKFKGVPIIAITANATKEEIVKYSQVFDDYLTKPVSWDGLIETLARFLEHQKVQIIPESAELAEYTLSDFKKQMLETDANSQELRHAFTEELVPLYLKIAKIWSINDLDAFNIKNREIAVKYQLKDLQEYCNAMDQASDLFDVEEIEKLRAVYEQLVEISNNSVGGSE